ncbi:YtxH domain-containing protein [Sinirhodobacter populi]|uniref:YtxH domain-containing protein n=1 Tax=Paenirhodobacter populi TaxID=2306993 RepID=A0A443K485_9RHOB|nr:YtxH domain-containing protein [Sinirhodobacter populi]RWR05938.1 YtxH domain-containing protein [Sinirhodobacter populi]RWR27550.1 YtxH domain-containing protein [Sinirhodobacter populi]
MAKKKSAKKKKNNKIRYVEAAPRKATVLDALKSVLPETASGQLLLGVLIGGAVTYVMSDEELREKIIRQGVQAFGNAAGALAELKEQIADIQAEVMAEQSEEA